MISYLKGEIKFKQDNFVIIEVANIGYKVFCPANVLDKISENIEAKILTHLYLKEGIMDLYGFLSNKERELFKILIKISGIGPKAALSIASIGSEDRLRKAIENNDYKFFEGVKGLGKKRVQKIILELTGKFKEIYKTKQVDIQKDDALQALISLGFSLQNSKNALSQIDKEIKDDKERIKQAIKILGR